MRTVATTTWLSSPASGSSTSACGRSLSGTPGNSAASDRTWASATDTALSEVAGHSAVESASVPLHGWFRRQPRGGAAGRGHGAADPNGERCCLFEDSGEAGKHVVHDGIGDGFDPPSPSGTEIKHAWLVTADHAGRSGSYALERNREPTPAREAPASGDRQDDRHPGQLVESVRGNDQYRSSAPLFTDKPDVAALHYNSSLPAGLASIQSRSSEERAAGSSHCARSSSSE